MVAIFRSVCRIFSMINFIQVELRSAMFLFCLIKAQIEIFNNKNSDSALFISYSRNAPQLLSKTSSLFVLIMEFLKTLFLIISFVKVIWLDGVEMSFDFPAKKRVRRRRRMITEIIVGTIVEKL